MLTAIGSIQAVSSACAEPSSALSETVNIYLKVEVLGPDGSAFDVPEKRLKRALDGIGLMTSEASPFHLRGQAEIIDEQVVEGGYRGSEHLVVMELPLFLEDTGHGKNLASVTFKAKGMGKTRAKAIRAAATKFDFEEGNGLAELRDTAYERVALLLEEDCNAWYAEGQQLHDKRKFREALLPLSKIFEAASVYPQAQSLKAEINQALWRQEENRVKKAQAEADKAQAEKEKAVAEAMEAEALAQATADSLEIVTESRKKAEADLEAKRITEAEYNEKVKKLDEMIGRLEELQAAAQADRETAVTGILSADETIVDYSDAIEKILPIPDPDFGNQQPPDGGRVYAPKSSVQAHGIHAKWELVPKECKLNGTKLAAATLELRRDSSFTIWIVWENHGVAMSRGKYALEGDKLSLKFDDPGIGELIGEDHCVSLRGDEKLLLANNKGDELAFCKFEA
jgi:hypothetical protein